MLPFPHAHALPRLDARKLLPSARALVIGFALLGASVLAYVGARETSVFAVRTIDVRGAPPQVATHVRAALAPLQGTSLLAVHSDDVDARLARLPDVASASYDRDFPHTLRLRVTPAHTIAVVRRGADAWLVASDDRIVRNAARGEAPLLPRVWVPLDADVAVGHDLVDARARAAIDAVATARRSGFAERILTVRAAANELTFVLAGRVELRFGDRADLALKLAVARRILPLSRGYGYVDVSVPERPVAGDDSQVSG